MRRTRSGRSSASAPRPRRIRISSDTSRTAPVRCGIRVLGLSPFGTDPSEDGLQPVLGWTSHVALCKRLRSGQSTGYGRRFVAEDDTWIGIVPVGYADG